MGGCPVLRRFIYTYYIQSRDHRPSLRRLGAAAMVQSDAGTTRLLLPKGPKTFEPCQMAAHTLEGMYEECFDALKA